MKCKECNNPAVKCLKCIADECSFFMDNESKIRVEEERERIKQIIKNRSNRKLNTLRKKEMKLDKKIYEAPKGSHEKKGWEQEMREINESIIHIRLFSDDILSKIKGEKE